MMLITVEYVKGQVNDIERCKGDDEAAHGREDSLYYAVLRWIAEGGSDAQALAAEAIKTNDIDFARWCA